MRFFAAVFFLLGLPLGVGWIRGDFDMFFTMQGAALFQAWGSAAALMVVDTLTRMGRRDYEG